MTTKSDPLEVIQRIHQDMETMVGDSLLAQCFEIQKSHQYDKDRSTLKEMQRLVESVVSNNVGEE